MPTGAKTRPTVGPGVQAKGAADPRVPSVGTHHDLALKVPVFRLHHHAVGMPLNPTNRRLEAKLDPASTAGCHQTGIEVVSANAHALRPVWKLAAGPGLSHLVADPPEGLSRERHPQASQGGHSMGHQAFAAGRLAWESVAVEEDHFASPLPQAQRGRRTGDTGSHHDDFCVERHVDPPVLRHQP